MRAWLSEIRYVHVCFQCTYIVCAQLHIQFIVALESGIAQLVEWLNPDCEVIVTLTPGQVWLSLVIRPC